MKPMNGKSFVDSNILLYLADVNESSKKSIAKDIIEAKPFTSVQVVFECLNVCLKKFRMQKEASKDFVKNILKTCVIIGEEKETGIFAIELFSKYSLQVFDSKIIATALDAGCSILYSEDMQNGLLIENRLTVINPFL